MLAKPWLELPFWLSHDVYEPDGQQILTLHSARAAAALHSGGNTGGRPREASSPAVIFGYTWLFLRARTSINASENVAASPASAYNLVRHGIWALIQALEAASVIKWPTVQEIAELVAELPDGLRNSMGHGQYWFSSIDGTLIRLPAHAVANNPHKESYWCAKKAHNSPSMVGNSLANLFIADW
eukprot:TRINITY_DN1266_c0_g1_i1.p1 TRINITY_DN1266_c0_g1~~TRINITY_DN1266_c0_g1_i1.p1  ORF type:complete len:184 (+),score=4.30 TRINITY_DN1266_c0_g1_i1:326-877(+)